MSPRSGTPVKLLGREDASVDWYNLEKSKRVKSFRCGEFDACIEKAESTQGVPLKKREKYARREDAILHALELEKKQLEMEQNKSRTITNGLVGKPSAVPKSDNLLSSDISNRYDDPGMHRKYVVTKSELLSKKPSVLQENNVNNSKLINNRKDGKPVELEEDAPEAVPRMRGLQDFGLPIAPKKKMLHSSTQYASDRPSGTGIETFIATGDGMEGAGYTNDGKSTLGTRRKRTNGCYADESLVKKCDRSRPLVQVLQSSAKLQASYSSQLDGEPHFISMQGGKDNLGVKCRAKRTKCIYVPPDANDTLEHSGCPPEVPARFRKDSCLERPGSLVEEYPSSDMFGINECDFSGKDFLEDLEEGQDPLGDARQSLASGSKDCDPAIFQVSENFVGSDNDEVPLCSFIPHLHQDEHYADGSADGEVSNWHLKGKRNVRNLAKKPFDAADLKIGGTEKSNSRDTSHGSKGSGYKLREMYSSGHKKIGQDVGPKGKQTTYSSDGVNLQEGFSPEQMFEYSNGHHSSALKSGKDRSNDTSNHELERNTRILSRLPWEKDLRSNVARNYWEESDECLDRVHPFHLSKEKGDILVNADLKVQTNYHGEHVPLVSLMSRLNGKAIIGHPVQVEILEDGSTNRYFPSSYASSHDGKATQLVWRTARRTVMQRIPRPNPATSALEDENDVFNYSGRESKPPMIKCSEHFNNHIKSTKKSSFHSKRSSGKFRKRSLKRSSLASKKTRMLSSIGTDPKHKAGNNRDVKHSSGSNVLGGLIKPEGSVPLITCIPLKVAFSRILEAVGRPSAATHRARITNTILRDPS